MKKTNICAILIYFALVLGCKSSQMNSIVLDEEYKVINAHFEKMNEKYRLYYRTIKNMSSGDTLSNKITIGQLNFQRFKNGLPKQVNYDTIFTRQTLEYLQQNFADLEEVTLDRRKIYSTELKRKEKIKNLIHITVPIITKNGRFALFYTEGVSFQGKLVVSGDGSLWVYKKNSEGEWSFYSTSLLWII